MHRLLARQVQRAKEKSEHGEIDVEHLLELIDSTYGKMDSERMMTNRAIKLMSLELTELNLKTLRQSEAKVKTVIDNVAEGIITFDAEGIITTFNPAAEKIFGYHAGEVIGEKVLKIIEDHETENCYLETLRQEKERFLNTSQELKGHHREGSTFSVEVTFSEMMVQDEFLFIGIVRNIEENKLAMAALKASEKKYRSLFNQIADAIVIFDRDTKKFLDCNKSVTRIYGYTLEELQQLTPMDLHPPEELERVKENVEIANPEQGNTYTHLTKSGRPIQVEILTDEVEYQGRPAWISIIRDITERRRAEEDVRKLSQAVEQSPSAVIITDTEGRIEYVNPKFCDITGYSPEEALGKNPRILNSGVHPPELFHDLWNTLMSGEEWRGEICNRRKNGELFWEIASICPIRKPDGEITHFIAVKEDITVRKHFEQELKQAKEDAEAASRTKSEFLANMSHEIRTPLNAIIGMTELTLDTPLSPEQKSFLDVVQNSSDGLLSLINDILDFSKIEAGEIELEIIDFDLHSLVENVAEMFSIRAHSKELELLCYIEPEVPRWVQGDPTKLKQVLVNLMGNAIKFTEKGEVALEVHLRNGVLNKNHDQENVGLVFSVRDTGIGISRKNISKIFEKFSQEDNSTTRRFGGTGLGLSISKSLIDLMEGKLRVKSSRNKGSVFDFTLTMPLGKSSEAGGYTYPEFDQINALIVDDNATNRFILRQTLSAWGIHVHEAAGGKSALSILEDYKEQFQIIILDFQMPEFDGLQTAEAIRKKSRYDDTRIIVLSSGGSVSSEIRDELQISDFLNKPAKQSKLMDVILRSLRIEETEEQRHAVKDDDIKPELSGGCRKRILLVEDNIDNQRLATKMLKKKGYDVDVAGNGVEAVEKAKKIKYDLILMDIYMPEMDGLDATTQIRAMERNSGSQKTPIIAVTAHAVDGYREKCLEYEMTDYITKPIKKNKLYAVVGRWLDSKPSILIVDDSDDNLNLLINHLKKTERFNLMIARNGREAVRIFKQHSLSLILMDMEMPVMNGYEATAAIRNLEKQGRTPIIALTAHTGASEVKKCLGAGCDSYLSKPIRRAKLIASINVFLKDGQDHKIAVAETEVTRMSQDHEKVGK